MTGECFRRFLQSSGDTGIWPSQDRSTETGPPGRSAGASHAEATGRVLKGCHSSGKDRFRTTGRTAERSADRIPGRDQQRGKTGNGKSPRAAARRYPRKREETGGWCMRQARCPCLPMSAAPFMSFRAARYRPLHFRLRLSAPHVAVAGRPDKSGHRRIRGRYHSACACPLPARHA